MYNSHIFGGVSRIAKHVKQIRNRCALERELLFLAFQHMEMTKSPKQMILLWPCAQLQFVMFPFEMMLILALKSQIQLK